jgi:hypothetical protein
MNALAVQKRIMLVRLELTTKIIVFWNVTSYSQIYAEVSEECASIFKVEVFSPSSTL